MHLNDLSKIYLDNIAEEAIDTDDFTGLLKARDAAKDADALREKSKKNNKQKKKEQKKAKKEVKPNSVIVVDAGQTAEAVNTELLRHLDALLGDVG